VSSILPDPFAEPTSATALRPVASPSRLRFSDPLTGGRVAPENNAPVSAPASDIFTCAPRPSCALRNVTLPASLPPAISPALSSAMLSPSKRTVPRRSRPLTFGNSSTRPNLNAISPANLPNNPEPNGSLDQDQPGPSFKARGKPMATASRLP